MSRNYNMSRLGRLAKAAATTNSRCVLSGRHPWRNEALSWLSSNAMLLEDTKERAIESRWSGLESDRTAALPRPNNASTENERRKDTPNAQSSPSELSFAGNTSIPITSRLSIVAPQHDVPTGIWPVFRMMDENGHFRDGTADAFKWSGADTAAPMVSKSPQSTMDDDELSKFKSDLKALYPLHARELDQCALLASSQYPYPDTGSRDTLLRAYTQMVRIREMDGVLQNAQRQGRISFYMTCTGEEAMHFGAASALDPSDVVLAQYREAGLLMWRGFSLQQFTDQCFSNEKDLGKGRQMPVHYGSRALNYQTISSPLGTQIPQAAGAAYRLKLAGKQNVAICFFGDGCASTIDFHSGMNFAATLQCPVVFFCRNNGYAISTPVSEQYAGDGIVSRAPGYGMAALRVDGNDIFAVHAAVREARDYALRHNAPVLVEAMSYRQGHHSTSDDSLRYRSSEEVKHHSDSGDPIHRVQLFLRHHGKLSDDEAQAIRDSEKVAVIDAMRTAEERPKPHLDQLFEDVYNKIHPSLLHQKEQLLSHIAKYPSKYQ